MVSVTCPHLEFLLKPLDFEDGYLLEGLLVSPTLVAAKKGLFKHLWLTLAVLTCGFHLAI